MSHRDSVLKAALRLSDKDRIRLASALLDSVHEREDLTQLQRAELLRRQAELKKHPRRGIPWEKARAELLGANA